MYRQHPLVVSATLTCWQGSQELDELLDDDELELDELLDDDELELDEMLLDDDELEKRLELDELVFELLLLPEVLLEHSGPLYPGHSHIVSAQVISSGQQAQHSGHTPDPHFVS